MSDNEMTTKWTAEKWHHEPGIGEAFTKWHAEVFDEFGHSIALVPIRTEDDEGNPDNPDRQDAEKIARLLAASPALAEALQALVAQRDRPHGFPDNPWYEREFEQARAALKAAGL